MSRKIVTVSQDNVLPDSTQISDTSQIAVLLRSLIAGKQDAGDYVSSSDPRLSDTRTPKTHQHTMADVSDLSINALIDLVNSLDIPVPTKFLQDAVSNTPLVVQGKVGEPHNTTNANLTEWRSSISSGQNSGGAGDLITYINEEGLLRIQSTQNNKCLFRMRKSGNSSFLELTNITGSEVLVRITSSGIIEAPNIGVPILGVLEAGQQAPANTGVYGVYLRKKQ